MSKFGIVHYKSSRSSLIWEYFTTALAFMGGLFVVFSLFFVLPVLL